MAPLTLPSVLPQVDVVLLVAGQAGRVQLHFISGLLVTTRAIELCVSARKRESCLFTVVEFPDAPAVGRMTLGACIAQRAFVNVILLVAVDAFQAYIPISLRDVALLAWHGNVQTQQGKFCEVVIEAHTDPPPFRRVALLALLAKLAGMDITGTVAARAVVRQFLGRHVCRVAGMTVDLCMEAGELPMSVAVVVETRWLPLLVAVAFAAVFTEAPGVRILALVAADALPWQLVLEVSRAVAVLTVNSGVHSLEAEPGLFFVVEFRGLPARRGVAIAAFRSALTPMNVFRGMA